MKVLLAEDDPFTREGLTEVLTGEGYDVVQASDGQSALELFDQQQPDFVCLDIMMPGVSGFDVCKRIRSSRPDVPIIFISAKSEEIDKVIGLELGADDFIVKPFGVKEVVARIRAVARRCRESARENENGETKLPFVMDDLEVFPAELRARRGNEVIELSVRDVKVLQILYQRRGQVLDRNMLCNHCWGEDYFPNSRALDQHISQLRKRIERDAKSPRIIHTVHGAGYRYDGD
ncbi:MAG: response regulator transcription factor [Planctomycetes bacterium]|nr:response regulator transcription factor [Planctomycetota bacterium]